MGQIMSFPFVRLTGTKQFLHCTGILYNVFDLLKYTQASPWRKRPQYLMLRCYKCLLLVDICKKLGRSNNSREAQKRGASETRNFWKMSRVAKISTFGHEPSTKTLLAMFVFGKYYGDAAILHSLHFNISSSMLL